MNNWQDMTQDRLVRPVHPGEVIADILDDLEITPTEFAEIIGVPNQTVNEIINCQRTITVDIAIRLGKALGTGPRLWLNLQQKIDVWDALQSHKEEYDQVMTLV